MVTAASSVDANAPAGVAGARIMHMRQILQQRYPEALERALSKVPSTVREEFLNASSMSWVSTTTDYAVHDAVAQELGREAVPFHEEILREAVDRSFKTLWRILLRFTTDEALVARTPAIYARTRNAGEMTSRLTEKGRAQCVLKNYPSITARDAKSITVGLSVVMTLTGRKNVNIAFQKTDDGAVYTMTWL